MHPVSQDGRVMRGMKNIAFSPSTPQEKRSTSCPNTARQVSHTNGGGRIQSPKLSLALGWWRLTYHHPFEIESISFMYISLSQYMYQSKSNSPAASYLNSCPLPPHIWYDLRIIYNNGIVYFRAKCLSTLSTPVHPDHDFFSKYLGYHSNHFMICSFRTYKPFTQPHTFCELLQPF